MDAGILFSRLKKLFLRMKLDGIIASTKTAFGRSGEKWFCLNM